MGKINFEEIDNYLEKYYQEGNLEKYEEMLLLLKEVDLTEIYERDDNTSHTMELACAGGACEIK